MERETDLKEQLERSEEESKDHTLKLSRLEDENESLVQQLKKMSSGGSGKGGLRGGGGVGGNVSDMKLQLEVSEQETSVLRKKVENLLSENLRLNKDVKDLNAAIGEEKKKKSGTPTGAGGWRNNNSSNASQLDELQTELNTTRIKLIERERDFERYRKSHTRTNAIRCVVTKMVQTGTFLIQIRDTTPIGEGDGGGIQQRGRRPAWGGPAGQDGGDREGGAGAAGEERPARVRERQAAAGRRFNGLKVIF